MTDKPDRPGDPVPVAPPVPGKTDPLPPEMPVPGSPAPEIMPTPTPHPAGATRAVALAARRDRRP